jgi:hypothetical protein
VRACPPPALSEVWRIHLDGAARKSVIAKRGAEEARLTTIW